MRLVWRTPRLLACILLAAALCAAQQPSGLPAKAGGWKKGASKTGVAADPAENYPEHAAALKESGIATAERATYKHAGRSWQVLMTRYEDAAGAYSAFTLLRSKEMQAVALADGAEQDAKRVLLLRGEKLLEITTDAGKTPALAELKAFVAGLAAAEKPAESAKPQSSSIAAGAAAEALAPKDEAGASLPYVVQRLPESSLLTGSIRYILGPAGYAEAQLPGALTPQAIDFSRSPELASAEYTMSGQTARVLIVKYPTPQIAAEQIGILRAAIEGKPQSAGAQARDGSAQSVMTLTGTDNATYALKRSGPLVVVAFGTANTPEVQALAESVNYSAQVTWDQETRLHKRPDNVLGLLVGIFVLIALLIAGYLVLLIFFGGAVVILQRIFPRWRMLPAQQEGFIKLNLKD